MSSRRTQKKLSPALDKRLASYTLAGTFGITCIVGQSANAAVVYTSVKDIREPSQSFLPVYAPIDLNHDGKMDFVIGAELFGVYGTLVHYRTATLFGNAPPGNQIAVSGSHGSAAALVFGKEIGPALKFTSGISHAFRFASARSVGSGPRSGVGFFYNQTNKFVGLKFVLDGKTYYGWARLSAKVSNPANITFELVDYAYQNVPNVPILAGQGIPKPDAGLLGALLPSPRRWVPAPAGERHPASLGMLAYGFQALPIWRGKQPRPCILENDCNI